MIRRILAGLLLAAFAGPGVAATSIPLPATPPVLRGEFSQSRSLQGFRNPLQSSGQFLLAKGRGVVWDTRAPFPSRSVLTRKALFAEFPDGSRRLLFDSAASPATASINALLLALVGGDVEVLRASFSIEATAEADAGWRLQLTPRAPGLAKAIRAIEVCGHRYVEQVTVTEAGGDLTRIVFGGFREEPATLSGAEAAQFE